MATIIEKEKALDVVRQMVADGQVSQEVAEWYFPELKESEDERIRKNLIEYFLHYPDHEINYYGLKADSVIAWLEKQGEQKPADKVEPKFKVGDWFIKNDGSHINKDYNTCKISKVGNVYYAIESIYGYTGKISFETFDTNFHLWKIQDAKDGDVLYSLDSNRPFIYKERNGYEQAKVYCGINIYGKFFVWNTKDCIITTDKYIPATKEQRDILFQKIKEAGYEWDAKKLELKKIEQKPAWSEEDEKQLQHAMLALQWYAGGIEVIDWIKSLKDRVQPMQEWSEEDKRIKDNCISFLGFNKEHSPQAECIDECINWLKSLRPQNRWKPSDKQIEALDFAADCIVPAEFCFKRKELKGLLEQLKKLKE